MSETGANEGVAQPATAFSWQMNQWQQLGALLEAKRLPHALLLSGPQGIGKLRFAQAFAHSLLCQDASTFAACGHCQSCRLLAAGNHPDYREISPEEGKRQIGVDQVRQLQSFVGQHAHREGGRKLVVLHPAEAMNINTANALLKTLEEPAGDTVLLLVSHAPSQLLATIRSRCLQMSFGVPDQKVVLNWLQNYIGDEALCSRLLTEASGRPLAAKALFDQDGLSRWQGFDEQLQGVIQGRQSPVQLAELLAGEDILETLDWWLQRGLRLLKQVSAGVDCENPVWQAFAKRSAHQLVVELDKAQLLRAKMQRGATLNKRLVWEEMLLNWFA
ncbi:DNA polymerase III subunit delta' [Spongiibacter sp. KMU-158]|uniref:DNA-directed DNA polymerase n=1 Tax=Spongiibacter pelagi TaxID=2760804 RepID=A0A927C3U9_9GAMM|nr:DNA polymerase III subunit delta' [Spongiibacter pelagi]MBD2859673.1 DNA polymerase III subunit delta' [Spongiibacter pelagi]